MGGPWGILFVKTLSIHGVCGVASVGLGYEGPEGYCNLKGSAKSLTLVDSGGVSQAGWFLCASC